MDVLSEDQNLIDQSLLEVPPYFQLNRKIGLPDQSVALEEAVKMFRGDLPRLLQEARNTAPFLFKTNFSINNIVFFLKNLDKCKTIFQKFEDIAAQRFIEDASDKLVVYELLTGIMQSLIINKKVGKDLPSLLNAIDIFLTRVFILARRSVKLSIEQFVELLNILASCRSQTEIDRIFSEIKPGDSIQQAIDRSGVKPAKFKIVSLKILDGCTVQCRYCSEKSKGKREEWNLMTVSDLKKLDWFFKDAVQISVSGGEPFDSPYLFDIMQFLASRNVTVAFFTSGGEIENLEKMLPYFKNGTVGRIDLSMHDSIGLKARKKFHNTVAFLIRHNIPFVIIPKAIDQNDLDSKGTYIDCELSELGLATTGELMQEKKNKLRPYYPAHEIALARDPLVRIEYGFIMPSAKLTDENTLQNLQKIVETTLQAGYKPSQLCRFGNVDFRSDGTVSACDAIVGPLRCKRLMDHFPESGAELDAALAVYRARMQEIWDEADKRKCYTCQVHLEKDAGIK